MSNKQVFYYGKVSDCQDPDKLGRLKVAIESAGEATETAWLPMLTMQAGAESGLFMMPNVDDQVLVAYLDPNHQSGVVLGSVWTPNNPPPATEENTDADLNADGNNNLKFYRSKSGLRLIFDDTEGKEKIQLLSKDAKTRFEFDTENKVLNIETDQDLTLTAKKNLSIEAETIEIKSTETTSIESAGLSIKSSKALSIEASQELSAVASSIKLND